MAADPRSELLVSLTADIVSAYVAENAVGREALPELLTKVHKALQKANGAGEAEPQAVPEPAVPVKKSIHKDHLVCLVCGGSFKSLKRHLNSNHALTPSEYRSRFGLPGGYPMIAPDYAAARSAMAIELGLGRRAASAGKKSKKSTRNNA